MCFCFSAIESEKVDLLNEIEKLKERVENEKRPNIAFEKENEELKYTVRHSKYIIMSP